jgi:hypothetical protein
MMATTQEKLIGGVKIVDADEASDIFDALSRQLMNISGEEFLRRWEAGEYADVVDTPDHLHITRLALLIPLAKQKP